MKIKSTIILFTTNVLIVLPKLAFAAENTADRYWNHRLDVNRNGIGSAYGSGVGHVLRWPG